MPSGVKWATFNVGATTPEEYGNYYAWGETEQAAASWGGEWRMPSKDDFQELIDKCEWEWMSKNGVNGYKVIGPNGNSIFLPAAGVKIAGVTNDDKTHGGYWSSTIDNELAYYLMFSYSEEGFENDYGIVSNELYGLYQYDNNIGMTIRPVIGEGIVEPDEQPNYESIDLGLPSGVKWASFNVGATTPEEYGNYYAWGETELPANNDYSVNNCSTYDVEIADFSGNPTFDAATANWGEEWRMPSKDDFQELIDNCTWNWTTRN